MIGPELLLACAPNVAPQTIERVIRVRAAAIRWPST